MTKQEFISKLNNFSETKEKLQAVKLIKDFVASKKNYIGLKEAKELCDDLFGVNCGDLVYNCLKNRDYLKKKEDI